MPVTDSPNAVDLVSLWLPVLASAGAAWMFFALAWMVLPHHRGDASKLPDEDGVMNALRSMNIPVGNYMFPRCSHKESRDPAFMEKWKRGPAGMLNIWKSDVSMGKPMVLSFLVYLAVSAVVGYLAASTLPAGTEFAKVFQVTGTAGVLGYCFAFLPGGIWFQSYARAMIASFVDGLIVGLGTGAIFAALWPAASAAAS